MTSFKICSCCSKEFKTEKEFKDQCEFIGEWLEFGLLLFNCKCHSTLSIEMFEGSKDLAKRERKCKLKVNQRGCRL